MSRDSYIAVTSGKPWKNKSDYKASKRHWNNSALRQRSPAGYSDFKNQERAYLDRRAQEKEREPSQSGGRTTGLSRENINRDSGEFQDIKYALREDAQLGYDAAERLKSMAIDSGLASSGLLDRLDSLRITSLENANQSASGTNALFTDKQKSVARLLGIKNLANPANQNRIRRTIEGAAAAGVRNLDSANDISKIEAYYKANPSKEPRYSLSNPAPQAPQSTQPQTGSAMTPAEIRALELQALQTVGFSPAEKQRYFSYEQPNQNGFRGGLSDLAIANQQMENTYQQQLQQQQLQFQAQFDQTTEFMNSQLNSANAALEQAEKRANNMMNAFVPQANPNALTAAYGDDRNSSDPGARKVQDNGLSYLKILSGLGSETNPLSGLQLA